ncbi:DUF2316 family protein [Luteipulveratus flavus]|uniref:DUF2316 family protein n=1 Tax=Luteipulveratus flavus TaxID=3031728 RepID=A0ABT6CC96_9MICO|nr:DUF2316 family protein [Luteipulveratus sp. YIM 133296]MDF8266128.1 DUF2316 family protein [Luteipulveratus sp. YIM 133296]
MSLDHDERERTRRELRANLELSGLDRQAVASALDLTTDRLDATLDVTPTSRPADVWLLRDFLDRAIRDQGGEPHPWSVLTDDGRRRAARWFRLREAPPAR